MALDAGHVEELIIEEVYEDEIEPEDKELDRKDENDMEEGEISGQGKILLSKIYFHKIPTKKLFAYILSEDLFIPVRGIKARLGRRLHHAVPRGSLNTNRLPVRIIFSFKFSFILHLSKEN